MSKQEEKEIESGAGAADLEVVTLSALEATERASIDIQISTAKKYPRSLQAFKKRAIEMATIDEETAATCIFRRPVGKELNPQTGKMEQKFAEGMSIRMAEIVGACYGNLRVKAFMMEENPRFVKACGQAIDLETNFASSSEAMESCIDKQGRPYSERTRLLTGKVALSKARRDATFQVVPRALARPVEAAVRSLLMGDTKTLSKRREMAVGWISKLGIDPKRVYEALGVAGPDELGIDQLETLTGLKTAIKDNDTTIDEAFPAPGSDAPKKSLGDMIGAKKDEKPVADDPAEKKIALAALEGACLDAGWTEAGTVALAQPPLPKGAKLADLSLAQIAGLVELAKKEGKT